MEGTMGAGTPKAEFGGGCQWEMPRTCPSIPNTAFFLDHLLPSPPPATKPTKICHRQPSMPTRCLPGCAGFSMFLFWMMFRASGGEKVLNW